MWIASLCEAFPGRLPSEVLAEYQRLPAGFLEEMLEAMAYRQAKTMTDAADTREARQRLPDTPIYRLVTEIELRLAQEELDDRGSAHDD